MRWRKVKDRRETAGEIRPRGGGERRGCWLAQTGTSGRSLLRWPPLLPVSCAQQHPRTSPWSKITQAWAATLSSLCPSRDYQQSILREREREREGGRERERERKRGLLAGAHSSPCFPSLVSMPGLFRGKLGADLAVSLFLRA